MFAGAQKYFWFSAIIIILLNLKVIAGQGMAQYSTFSPFPGETREDGRRKI